MRTTPKVAIVGYGPSAMYAILACNHKDVTPDLYAKDFTIQPGAFWLKWMPFPESDNCIPYDIRIFSIGSQETYIQKQWKTYPKEYTSSFSEGSRVERGFNPYEVMQNVFNGSMGKYRKKKVGYFLKDEDLENLSESYNLVFHTFPTELAGHEIENVIVQFPVISYHSYVRDNFVIYDGSNGEVVRSSFLFKIIHHEYSLSKITDKFLNGIIKDFRKDGIGAKLTMHYDIKPTEKIPKVSPIRSNVFPIGRLALLDRTVLAHDSFNLVTKVLEEYDQRHAS